MLFVICPYYNDSPDPVCASIIPLKKKSKKVTRSQRKPSMPKSFVPIQKPYRTQRRGA